MNCYVIFITFHHCCFRSEEWWRPVTFTWSQSLSVVGSPHREASLFTLHQQFVCHLSYVMIVIWRPRLLFGILPAWYTHFSSLTLKGVRTHGIMESWRIWHCYLQENEHFIGWVVKQHQMVDLNKNFIRSLFCHFLVLLLILSMFNHFFY